MSNEKWQEFIRACESQWRIGGKRYAEGQDREWTDTICEIVGNAWIGGNILKYAGEIRNYKRIDGVVPEVDFFKIFVYSFIWWLKEFKYPTTGIKLKKNHWPEFVESVKMLGVVIAPVTVEQFVNDIQFLVKVKIDHGYFLLLGARAFSWWLQEQGNFTQRDEGEEFEK